MAYAFDKYDADKFEEGVWEEHEGGQFKVARMGNPRYRDAARRLNKEYRKRYGEEMSAAQEDEMHAEAMAIGLLRDWAVIIKRGEDGEEVAVPYSVDTAKTLLIRDPGLANFVAQKSTDLERYENDDIEEQTKKR